MSDRLDFERFEKQVKTFAQIKKKYERLLNEFYSNELFKGSYVDKSTIGKALELAKQDDQNRTRAFVQQHLVNHRIIEYLACLQVQVDNIHQFLSLMIIQMGSDAPKTAQSILKKLQKVSDSATRSSISRSGKDRRARPTRRSIYDLDYQGEERRIGPRRRKGRRKSTS